MLPLPSSIRTITSLAELSFPSCGAWAVEAAHCSHTTPTILDGSSDLSRDYWVTHPFLIWLGEPPDIADETFMTKLPPADREHVIKLRDPMDRSSIATGRIAVRWLLGAILGHEAEDLAFSYSERGKPSLDPRHHGDIADRLFFSVSHIRGLVAVAVATFAVGVDVEAMCAIPEMEMIARDIFMPDTLRCWDMIRSEADRTALFYRFWTLSEAFIKATGEGLSQDLKTFAFSASGTPALVRVDDRWGPCHRWLFGVF